MSGDRLEFENPIKDAVSRLRFSPESNNLLVASWDSYLRLYNVESSPLSLELYSEAALIDCCFENESTSFTSGSDGFIRSFVARIFGHALEDSHSKSALVHSLSVCTSLLDPRRSAASSSMFNSFRGQQMFESPIPVSQENIGDLLRLLTVASDSTILSTTYGELRPPLGKHRLKIVEFIAVLLKTASEAAQKELVSSGTIKRTFDLFFEYPFNNALHHQVESIILFCLENKSDLMVNHILRECNLIGKLKIICNVFFNYQL